MNKPIDISNSLLIREFKEKEGRELGMVLSKDYWGSGLMTEAVKKVISYLFEKENLDFIVSGYFDENKGSENVQRKCGFISYKRRTFETSYGQIKNGWLCILEREDWKDFS